MSADAIADSAIDLVVTDLDGTLWGADEVVHDRTLDALRALEARGVPVLVATGRRLRSAVETLARSGLTLPTVVLDGSLGRDVGAQRTFHRAAFAPAQAQAVLAACREAGISPCVYVDRDDAEVVVDRDPSTHPQHLRSIGRWLEVRDDLTEVVATEPVLAFAVVSGDRLALDAIVDRIGDTGATSVTRDIIFGGSTLSVRAPSISKWEGVVAWCEEQGLDHSRVLALGDGDNDLELLGAARVACVVSDGCEPALALAHHVIDPAHAGGWSAVLDHV